MHCGIGYDIHRLAPNRRLILGGVEIPSVIGLLGHSDADVVCHAIMDALLGAAALGDIGEHFPDNDPRYEGISSLVLLRHVATLLEEHGFAVVNVDCTLILQHPKIAPYARRMRENIAKTLNIDVSCVSVKATTNEGLDALGNGQGAAAQAIATLQECKRGK